MENLLKPTGHSRESFVINEGGMGLTVLESMLNAKSPVKDLGVHRHKYISSSGLGTLCNNRGFGIGREVHLPDPRDPTKIFSISIPKLERRGKRMRFNIGTYTNELDRRRVSTKSHLIELNGFDKNERPKTATLSLVLTDDKLFILVKMSGPGLNGKPDFSVYFSLVYDFEDGKINKGVKFVDSFHSLGIKLYQAHHEDHEDDDNLKHSPFWDKEKDQWILAVNSHLGKNHASILTYDPITKTKVIERTGKVFSNVAMVTLCHKLINNTGGLSQVGKGTHRALLGTRIQGAGNMGGFGKVSTLSTITVLTSNHNYFASFDSTGSNYTSATYGAVDYHEEVTFREEVARYLGL